MNYRRGFVLWTTCERDSYVSECWPLWAGQLHSTSSSKIPGSLHFQLSVVQCKPIYHIAQNLLEQDEAHLS